MDERNLPTRKYLVAIVALCILGAWISGQLVQAQAGLWSSGAGDTSVYARVCGAFESLGFDCTGPVHSRWSELAIPVPIPTRSLSFHLHRIVVPIAFVGLAYFVFLGTWFALAGNENTGSRMRTPLWFARGGAVFSVACLAAMVSRIAPLCVWCVFAHVVSLATAILVELWRARSAEFVAGEWSAARRSAMRACAVGLILVAGLWYYRREQLAMGSQVRSLLPYRAIVTDLRNDADFLLREHLAQPIQAAALNDDAEGDGCSVLTVFTDFGCSACACTSRRIDSFVAPTFDGAIEIDVRHFPLDEACNEAVGGSVHPGACEAAYAAEAARMQGGDAAFDAMARLLYARHGTASADEFRAMAAEVGLDVEQFEHDRSGPEVRHAVSEDVLAARQLGVTATPAIFLDGRRVTELCVDNPVFWEAMASQQQMVADEVRASAE